MKKILVIFSIFLSITVLFSGCNLSQAVSDSTDDPEILTGITQEFTMTAKQWEFEPSEIIVNKGDTVKLHISSTDVTHGFGLPDFGVNETLEAGKTVDIEFVADKTGTFTFSCTVFCGSGHGRMNGKLIVQ